MQNFDLVAIRHHPWLRAIVICVALWLVLYGFTLVVNDYFLDVLIISCYYLILAVSWNLLAGYAGRFSLAQPGFATLGAYSTGLLIKYEHVPIAIGIAFAAAVASFSGLVLAVAVYRMQGTYLALTTWAFSISLQISLIAANDFTGGDTGLFLPALLGHTSNNRPYAYAFMALTTVAVLTMYFIVESRAGRLIRAIRDDELRASTLGVNVYRWKLFVFVMTSFWSGLAGAFYAHYILVISPVMDDFTQMSKLIAMVFVGGFGSFVGPIVGAPLLQVLSAYLQGYGQLNLLIYAVIVLVMMRLYRDGLVKLIARTSRRGYIAWTRVVSRQRHPVASTGLDSQATRSISSDQ